MKPVCFYLTVVLELGFLAISSTALPLFLVEEDTRGPQRMQKSYHLKITGNLVNGTMDPREAPRCGVTDLQKFTTLPGSPKFKKTSLTYRVQQYTPDLPRNVVDDILKDAFQRWADVTPLTFTQTTSPADIEIIFVSGDHGDGNPFDGPGRVLAHAFGPGPNLGGDAHFDEDERWVTGSNGFNLFIVATHEFGHSLGLDHSDVAGSVMLPFYKFVPRDSFKLSSDDIQGIQSLYGSSAVTTQAPGPTSTKEPSTCDPNLFADAAVNIGSYVFFKNGFYTFARSSRVIPVNSTWPSMVSNIDAAIRYPSRNQQEMNITFFSGSQYWLFTGTVLNSGFPKPISDFGFSSSVTKIDAASYARRNTILFFVGDQLWIYSTRRNQMTRRSPYLIRDIFTEISQVDAAFRHNGFFYLTSGPFVFKYKRNLLIKRIKPTGWMNCP
ncbi:stromelysin-1-like [Cetorhinus maximus]